MAGGVTTTCRTELKGHGIREVGNFWLRECSWLQLVPRHPERPGSVGLHWRKGISNWVTRAPCHLGSRRGQLKELSDVVPFLENVNVMLWRLLCSWSALLTLPHPLHCPLHLLPSSPSSLSTTTDVSITGLK